jgi:L-malate glycosyltransferase
MRISFISTMAGSPWTGSEELWAAAARSAVEQGHEVTASVFRWSSKPRQIEALEAAGVRIVWRRRFAAPTPDEMAMKVMNLFGQRPFERAARIPLLGSLGAGGAVRELLATKPEILCINQGSLYDLLDAPRSRSLFRQISDAGVPYVILCHLAIDTYSMGAAVREEVSRFFSGARRIGFVSQQNLLTAERQLAMRLPQASVVRNPVNLTDRTPVAWPKPAEPACFACVGRLDVVQKGQDILFETLSAPRWAERDWRLRVFGSGIDEGYLRKLAIHYAIDQRVEFAGYAQDVRSIWAANHLLVLPSRAEGTPLALVEAMTCGRPAVVSDVGGNAEWIEEGMSGWIAEAPTVHSFGSALERAWSDRNAWERIGRVAHDAATARGDPAPGAALLALLTDAVRAA